MDPEIRRKAQAHIYRLDENGRPRFLILQRTPAKNNVWQSVTGNIEIDEAVDDGALREIEEETQVRLSGRGVGEVWQYVFTKNGRQYEEHVYGFEADSDEVVLSHEHQSYAWVPAERALERIHYEGIREGLRRVLEALGQSAE